MIFRKIRINMFKLFLKNICLIDSSRTVFLNVDVHV